MGTLDKNYRWGFFSFFLSIFLRLAMVSEWRHLPQLQDKHTSFVASASLPYTLWVNNLFRPFITTGQRKVGSLSECWSISLSISTKINGSIYRWPLWLADSSRDVGKNASTNLCNYPSRIILSMDHLWITFVIGAIHRSFFAMYVCTTNRCDYPWIIILSMDLTHPQQSSVTGTSGTMGDGSMLSYLLVACEPHNYN